MFNDFRSISSNELKSSEIYINQELYINLRTHSKGFLLHPNISRREQQMLKTRPRKRLIHKLLDTFTSIPFGSARPYGETKKFLTLMLGYFTCTSFSAQNPLYPVFLVLITYCLVFAFCRTKILYNAGKP